MSNHKDLEKRIGREERDKAIGKLRRHYEDERLTLEEFQNRMSLAAEAKTKSQLVALFKDLPSLQNPEPEVEDRFGLRRYDFNRYYREFRVPGFWFWFWLLMIAAWISQIIPHIMQHH